MSSDSEVDMDYEDLEQFEDDDAQQHLQDLQALASKDPEFFKYLQENDKELLNWNPDKMQEDEGEDEGDGDEEEEFIGTGSNENVIEVQVLTIELLRRWQREILQRRSLKSLRNLLVAFRCVVYSEDDEEAENRGMSKWRVEDGAVYNKLVVTASKYTPIVLEHHAPLKNGRLPVQTPKFKAVQKLILGHFSNATHLISKLPSTSPPKQNEDEEEEDEDTDSAGVLLKIVIEGCTRLLPWVSSHRKGLKKWMKAILPLWSAPPSTSDEVRMSAFLGIRRLALLGIGEEPSGSDAKEKEGKGKGGKDKKGEVDDWILKNTYLTLLRSSKNTNVHTLPIINLMKNSGSEIFGLDPKTTYQHAFGYIRQLAIYLRNAMKAGVGNANAKQYQQQLLNWQFVHAIDFWCLVIGRGGLEELVYPLVQVALGAIKHITSPRAYPYHLHILKALLSLSQHVKVYIPLAPYLMPIVTHIGSGSGNQGGKLPQSIDLETTLRLSTSAGFTEVREEAVYVLAEWLACVAASREHGGTMGALAFPELIVPVVSSLRKSLKNNNNSSSTTSSGAKGKKKKGKHGKGASNAAAGDGAGGTVKVLIERVEETATVISKAREKRGISDAKTGPSMLGLSDIGETPLEKYVKVLRKAREKKRVVMEGVRKGQMEIDNGRDDSEDEGGANMENDMDEDDSEFGDEGFEDDEDVEMLSDDE